MSLLKANFTVPLNFGAVTNFSFNNPLSLPLEFTKPKLFAEFFEDGGGDSYSYGSLTVATTSSATKTTTTSSGSSQCLFCLTSTTSTSTPTSTPTEDITPNPAAYQNSRVGGGRRDYIYGSARWGSGIFMPSEDIPGNASWAPSEFPPQSSWPRPYGFWPIYWGEWVPNYYTDSFVYKSSRFRPGGAQNLILASSDGLYDQPFWYIIGDAYTIEGINTILALPEDEGGCGMFNGYSVYAFDPVQAALNGTGAFISADGSTFPKENFTVTPESAIQYYRGSSVVLGAPGYVNAYALDHNQNTSYWGMTPWNISDLFPLFFNASHPINTGANVTARYAEELSFLNCLNITIAAAVPIIDPSRTEEVVVRRQPWWFWAAIGIGIAAVLLTVWIYTAQCCLDWVIKRITGKSPEEWQRRRGPFGRHTRSRRAVLQHGEELPNYSREPINLSYPPASPHPLLSHRGSDTRTGYEEEILPPYTPRAVSPTVRR
ncbi:hypothetical protein CPB86DRAFT_285911 [Serendipita vermifera]|nr:hypothetical protein CPB86DRAFT_285911 [Serendipita vermifera]